MSGIVHDDGHLVMLPREDARESFTRLDALLVALLDVRLSPTPAATLIGEHLSHLTANLQKVPPIGQRPILDTSYPHAIRWMQLTLGTVNLRQSAIVTPADDPVGDEELVDVVWKRFGLHVFLTYGQGRRAYTNGDLAFATEMAEVAGLVMVESSPAWAHWARDSGHSRMPSSSTDRAR